MLHFFFFIFSHFLVDLFFFDSSSTTRILSGFVYEMLSFLAMEGGMALEGALTADCYSVYYSISSSGICFLHLEEFGFDSKNRCDVTEQPFLLAYKYDMIAFEQKWKKKKRLSSSMWVGQLDWL